MIVSKPINAIWWDVHVLGESTPSAFTNEGEMNAFVLGLTTARPNIHYIVNKVQRIAKQG